MSVLGDAPPDHARRESGVSAAVDGAMDGTVVAFAIWTLFYQVALATRMSVWTPAFVWLILAVVLLMGGAYRSVRASRRASVPQPEGPSTASVDPPNRTLLLVVLGVLGLVVLAPSLGVAPVAAGAILLLLTGVWLRTRRDVVSEPVPPTGGSADLVALGVSVGFSVLGAYLLKPDADDTHFVNRSAWVAERGVPALRDTLYGPEVLPSSYSGGFPMASIETLLGALAHLARVEAGTMVYLLALPVLAFLSAWATWRLVRAWAPRHALLAFLVAVVFILMSGDSTVGSYSLGRLWQGKALAFAFLTPLAWVYLSLLAERRRRETLLLLAACGISFVGLASTATLQVPMIAGPALLVALFLRDRLVALGAVLLVAAPVVSGVAVVLAAPFSVAGEAPVPIPVETAFGYMNGVASAMVAVSILGLVAGPLMVRRISAPFVAAAVVAALAMVLPGMFGLANAVTGAGPVLWRMLLGVPTWVLVGLLVTVRAPHAGALVGRVVGGLVAAALALVALLAGTPQWSPDLGARLTSHPTWKVDQRALEDVRALDRVRASRGTWLLPPLQMEVLPIQQTEHFPVVPRGFYLPGPEVRPGDQLARSLLYQTVSVNGTAPLPALEETRHALDQLDVGLMCAMVEDAQLRARLVELSGRTRRFAGLECIRLDRDGGPVRWRPPGGPPR